MLWKILVSLAVGAAFAAPIARFTGEPVCLEQWQIPETPVWPAADTRDLVAPSAEAQLKLLMIELARQFPQAEIQLSEYLVGFTIPYHPSRAVLWTPFARAPADPSAPPSPPQLPRTNGARLGIVWITLPRSAAAGYGVEETGPASPLRMLVEPLDSENPLPLNDTEVPEPAALILAASGLAAAWRAARLRARYISRRFSSDFDIVTSSAYSSSLPTGMPRAMRVTRSPSGLSSRER